jgi:hypothetical protein
MQNVTNPNPAFGSVTRCTHSPNNAPNPEPAFRFVTSCLFKPACRRATLTPRALSDRGRPGGPTRCSALAGHQLGDDQPIGITIDRPDFKAPVDLPQEPLVLLVATIDRMGRGID